MNIQKIKGRISPKKLSAKVTNGQIMIFKYVIEFEIIVQPLFKLFKNIRAFKSYKKPKCCRGTSSTLGGGVSPLYTPYVLSDPGIVRDNTVGSDHVNISSFTQIYDTIYYYKYIHLASRRPFFGASRLHTPSLMSSALWVC